MVRIKVFGFMMTDTLFRNSSFDGFGHHVALCSGVTMSPEIHVLEI